MVQSQSGWRLVMYGIRLTLAVLPFRPRSPASLAYTSQSRERRGNTAREGPRSGRKAHKTRNTPAPWLETFFSQYKNINSAVWTHSE